jgi:hypothetical protein
MLPVPQGPGTGVELRQHLVAELTTSVRTVRPEEGRRSLLT